MSTTTEAVRAFRPGLGHSTRSIPRSASRSTTSPALSAGSSATPRRGSSQGTSPVLTGSVKVASVDVNDENLTAHLQSPDFFDAERNPELSFESSEIERRRRAADAPRRHHDQAVSSSPVELTGTLSEPIRRVTAGSAIGLKLETTVDRTDFGVNWNAPLPSGEPALASEVKLAAELYFVREA